MTHSPGPWRYVPKSGQIVDANNRQIARVWNTSNRERDHANGELIAQAPQVMGDYDAAYDDLARLSGEYSELREALELAVRAIYELLPGAKHIPCDIGLVNTALITARPLL